MSISYKKRSITMRFLYTNQYQNRHWFVTIQNILRQIFIILYNLVLCNTSWLWRFIEDKTILITFENINKRCEILFYSSHFLIIVILLAQDVRLIRFRGVITSLVRGQLFSICHNNIRVSFVMKCITTDPTTIHISKSSNVFLAQYSTVPPSHIM